MKVTQELKSAGFVFLDFLVLLFIIAWEFILHTINLIGFAWWAKVETSNPSCYYWFGPFISNRILAINLEIFLSDLSQEKPSSIKHNIIRGYVKDPLTAVIIDT